MKKILTILLSLLMTVSVVGCSAKEQTAGKIDNTGNEASVDEPYSNRKSYYHVS